MSDREQFYKDFYSALEMAMEPEGGHLQEVTVPKNNRIMNGIAIKFEDIALAPAVYPDQYYSEWTDGKPMNQIIREICDRIEDSAVDMDLLSEGNLNRENAADHLQAAVVNFESNKEWLKEVPHERMADLAVYSKWILDSGSGMVSSVTVTDSVLAHLQLTKEEALKIAKDNTAEESKFYSLDDTMRDMVRDCGGDEEFIEELIGDEHYHPLYVLSNETGIGGAAMIACPAILKHAKEELGEDFYILPSSTHEVLLLKKSDADDMEFLKEMVSEINETHVPLEDRLSDSIYEFDCHGIRLAGPELTEEHDISESITHHRSR